jgi:hypothetical protein
MARQLAAAFATRCCLQEGSQPCPGLPLAPNTPASASTDITTHYTQLCTHLAAFPELLGPVQSLISARDWYTRWYERRGLAVPASLDVFLGLEYFIRFILRPLWLRPENARRPLHAYPARALADWFAAHLELDGRLVYARLRTARDSLTSIKHRAELLLADGD